MTSPRPIIIPLGGFLGAGKTTLILTAARILKHAGINTAAILNDQGSELVDTAWVKSQGVAADQVMGGCFCCLFTSLLKAAERLRTQGAQVIFAEAVGSCTDISATTLQPLKLYHADRFQLAPYTVLVDPARARQLSGPHADPDFHFLFHKQLEEADLVCFSKSDSHDHFPEMTAAPVHCLSAHTGDGVRAWLDELLSGRMPSGTRILDIDYHQYARAEATLAWLNCAVSLRLETALSPAAVVGPLLDNLNTALTEEGFQIAHLKISDDTESGLLKASITRNGAEPAIQGDASASPARAHQLLLNVRASGEAQTLGRVVEAHMAALPGVADVFSMQCFQPSAPKPQYRLSHTVSEPASEPSRSRTIGPSFKNSS
jgi:hypothetical protein